MNKFLYVSAAESGFMHTVIVNIKEELHSQLTSELEMFLLPKIEKLHDGGCTVALVYPDWLTDDQKTNMSSKMDAWRLLRISHVRIVPSNHFPLHSSFI